MTTRAHPTPAAVTRGIIRLGDGARVYTPVLGTPQDVLDADAKILSANGWFVETTNLFNSVGTTAQRPTADQNGQTLPVATKYSDTTISKCIWWDGATWRDMFSSASV